jgi:predicted MPP superfamily phosphohydrolase
MTEERDPHTMTRRQLMRHSAWFGAAVVLTVAGGEVISHIAGSAGAADTAQTARPTLRFAQISDSHIGFTGTANANVTDTFTEAINQINGLGYAPDFVIHTGDLTHLATPAQFDQVKQMMTGLKTPHIFTVPGEHDSIDDGGRNTARHSAPAPRATAGTASTPPACTSSRWSTPWT